MTLLKTETTLVHPRLIEFISSQHPLIAKAWMLAIDEVGEEDVIEYLESEDFAKGVLPSGIHWCLNESDTGWVKTINLTKVATLRRREKQRSDMKDAVGRLRDVLAGLDSDYKEIAHNEIMKVLTEFKDDTK